MRSCLDQLLWLFGKRGWQGRQGGSYVFSVHAKSHVFLRACMLYKAGLSASLPPGPPLEFIILSGQVPKPIEVFGHMHNYCHITCVVFVSEVCMAHGVFELGITFCAAHSASLLPGIAVTFRSQVVHVKPALQVSAHMNKYVLEALLICGTRGLHGTSTL